MSLLVHRLGLCAYAPVLELQDSLVERKLAGEAVDHLLLLEHEPTYTLGRGADVADLRGADERLGVPVFRISRGGGVTFHGPGQLVAYPILALERARRDVRSYIASLEDVLIRVCEAFGVAAERQSGQTGVWVDNRKIASIGVGLRRWTTFHGVALNVDTELGYFDAVVPCRMPDVRMTSLAAELSRPLAMKEVEVVFEQEFCRRFDVAMGQTDPRQPVVG